MKKITFAPGDNIRRFEAEVDQLILAIAGFMIEPGEDKEEWASSVFVSDESCVGDFLSSEADLARLSEKLQVPIQRRDLICNVAGLLHQRKHPN